MTNNVLSNGEQNVFKCSTGLRDCSTVHNISRYGVPLFGRLIIRAIAVFDIFILYSAIFLLICSESISRWYNYYIRIHITMNM